MPRRGGTRPRTGSTTWWCGCRTSARGKPPRRGRAATSHTLGPAVVPLAAEKPDPKTDDGAKLDGDLRELLLAKPAGAKDDALLPARDWLTIGDLAEYFRKPDGEFASLNAEHFRRAARAVWMTA